jgi:hypothetical protein
LTIQAKLAKKTFEWIITADESWFAYLIESDAMFASSHAEVAPRVRPSISCNTVMVTLFLTTNSRLILDALPKGYKYNQNDFIDNLLPALNQVRIRNDRHKVASTLMMHMYNSMRHNGAKISEKMSLKRLRRALHPAYSPDINPCDFWAFGKIQGMIKDRHL